MNKIQLGPIGWPPEEAAYQYGRAFKPYPRTVLYRGYHINRDTPMPWTFVHEEYDGAIDAHDHRHGYGNTLQECIDQIDEIEEGDEA